MPENWSKIVKDVKNEFISKLNTIQDAKDFINERDRNVAKLAMDVAIEKYEMEKKNENILMAEKIRTLKNGITI